MRITRIKIEGFGLFHQPLQIDFSDEKVNIVIGNNETGKTTLLQGIMATLFGVERSRWARYRAQKESEGHSGELEFTHGKKTYTVRRDFETNDVELNERQPGKNGEQLFKGKAAPQSRTEEKEFYRDFLKKILGVNSETVFHNINVVRQGSIEGDIDSEIQGILTGAIGTNFRAVLEKWQEEYFSLTRKSAWGDIQNRRSGREMELLSEELDRLNRLKDNLIEKSILAEKYETESRLKEKRIRELAEKKRLLAAEYEAARTYTGCWKEKKLAEDELLQSRKEEEKYLRLKTEYEQNARRLAEEYAGFQGLGDADILDLRECRKLEKELADRISHRAGVKNESRTGQAKKIFLGVNGLVLAGLLFLFRLRFNAVWVLYPALLLGLVSLAWLLLTLVRFIRTDLREKAAGLMRKKEIQDLEARIGLLRKKGIPAGDGEPDDLFFRKYGEYKTLKQQTESQRYGLDAWGEIASGRKKQEEIERSLLSVRAVMNELEKGNPALSRLMEDPESAVRYIQGLKGEQDSIEKSIQEADTESRSLHKRLAVTFAESESIAGLKYRIEEIGERLETLERTRRAYILAVNTLRSAVREYQEKHVDRLSRNISLYYEKITHGSHSRIALTEDFTPVLGDSDGEGEGNLSCGAREQLYFSVRLALLAEINNLTALPLLLDDPFVNFDKERLKVVKDILYSIHRENQIILFTHFRSYLEWENVHVIRL